MIATLGILRYSVDLHRNYKLIVELDQQLSDYYFTTIPRSVRVRKQLHTAHISVVRNEMPLNLEYWGKYEGHIIVVYYEHYLHNDETYWWLNAFSEELERIRTELGLENSSRWTRPPSGFNKCFHTTIANTK